MSRFHFGVHFPAGQQRSSNPALYAAHVDDLGFDSIWVIENLGSASAGLECLTTLGFFAASTPRLAVGTSVLLLPLRNPVVAAQAAATLQILSGGKFIFGIGVGGAEQMSALGSDARTRGRRCDEWLEVMSALWRGEPVTYHGEFIDLDDYALGPVPECAPAIWVGGHSQASERRAARHAQGYIPVGRTPAECAGLFARLDALADEQGRPGLTRAAHIYVGLTESKQAAMAMASATLSERYQNAVAITDPAPHLFGTADDCLGTMAEFEAAGVTHFVFDPICPSDQTESHVARLMHEVVEPFRNSKPS